MKKIFLVIVLAVLATTAVAQLQNAVFKAKVFISDRQTSIGEHDTEIFSYPVSDRKIEIDSIHGLANIELPTGSKLRRVIKFIEHSYESFGKVYNGYYQTNADEKIYIRENEIGFHAFSTFGMFFTFHLKETKERNDAEEKEEAEKINYGNILNMYGFHDATCYKYRRIEIGIDKMTVRYIFEEEKPIFEEMFIKGDSVIDISVYKEYIIRYSDLKVSNYIKLNYYEIRE
ncbi:hypothetical protein LI160_07085 [Bacteroides xylanisolvens]|uniref:hypothetical protein n=1 Tax=Bacteroides TaxID=816 RepID=UPI001D08DB8D|nr:MULTISPECIES: hypothetical protein [Bacteroides]MCB6713351.1 hypothetical protein [Bacteroides xylanisolvens]MCB6735765.1 hypothetical protein [Bacteroides xylanisolvens]MCB7012119.1 hypothetical protein [Bacteroides thetaiotaomicron]MCB7120576.1 hypothetical protein [Bacteroides xylanisolvens]MCB7367968.1 hypothetical protein [Bacteroides thetaiotaomicron]